MKKILFLDANITVVESIKYAKGQGFFTITCDNKKENIGHKYSDKQYYISTYDVDSLELVVETEKIDGIVYFASQHGLYGACRLIEKYSLSGFPLQVEQTISNKYNFRQFLNDNHFKTPRYLSIDTVDDWKYAKQIPLPLIVKPVDGGGNRGISKVNDYDDLKSAIDYALKESICKKTIVEEFIDSELQINGDCLYVKGKLIFSFLGKHLYPNSKSILPFATIFGPNVLPASIKEKVEEEIQRIITINELQNGVLNVELRVNTNGDIFFIEINPRHSGNRIYLLMNDVLNIPMEHIAVDIAANNLKFLKTIKLSYTKYYAYCLLFSDVEGFFEGVEILEPLRKYVIYKDIFKKKGDRVKPFTLLRERIGLLHLSFPTKDEMDFVFNNIKKMFKVNLSNENK